MYMLETDLLSKAQFIEPSIIGVNIAWAACHGDPLQMLTAPYLATKPSNVHPSQCSQPAES
jgi:hypothetical protein